MKLQNYKIWCGLVLAFVFIQCTPKSANEKSLVDAAPSALTADQIAQLEQAKADAEAKLEVAQTLVDSLKASASNSEALKKANADLANAQAELVAANVKLKNLILENEFVMNVNEIERNPKVIFLTKSQFDEQNRAYVINENAYKSLKDTRNVGLEKFSALDFTLLADSSKNDNSSLEFKSEVYPSYVMSNNNEFCRIAFSKIKVTVTKDLLFAPFSDTDIEKLTTATNCFFSLGMATTFSLLFNRPFYDWVNLPETEAGKVAKIININIPTDKCLEPDATCIDLHPDSHGIGFADHLLTDETINDLSFISGLIAVDNLDIHGLNITNIQDNAFVGLRYMSKLNLNGNTDLATIEDNAFVGIPAVTQVNLSGDRSLKEIPRALLNLSGRELSMLDLSGTGSITEIKENAFQGLKFTGTIDLTLSALNNISFHAFNGAEFTDLKISGEVLNNIATGAFNKVKINGKLFIQDTLINTIQANTFLGAELGSLYIRNNKSLTGILADAFAGIVPPSLGKITFVFSDNNPVGKDQIKIPINAFSAEQKVTCENNKLFADGDSPFSFEGSIPCQ